MKLFTLASLVLATGDSEVYRVQLFHPATSLWVRTAPRMFWRSAVLVASERVPWLHGSTFEVHLADNATCHLRSLKNGKWLAAEKITGDGGRIFTSADKPYEREAFFVNFSKTTWPRLELTLQASDGKFVGLSSHGGTELQTRDTWTTQEMKFVAEIVPFAVGVNIGSLFLPESWMVDFLDGHDFCTFCNQDREAAEAVVQHHLSTFVTEKDFAWMAAHGINSVRLPLGYWNVLGDSLYVPKKPEDSLRVLDSILDWAGRHHISVLLDLHGAPGSQNGFDNSGCSNVNITNLTSSGAAWNTRINIELSVKAIETLSRRYAHHPALLGIALLNEPGKVLEVFHHAALHNYYREAYRVVRQYSNTTLVVLSDAWCCGFGKLWWRQFEEPKYFNVALDMHLYDCFADRGADSVSSEQHVQRAESWKETIQSTQYSHLPVVVGEWSMATGANLGGQRYADAQLDSFSAGMGSFFWSYKFSQFNDAWSFHDAVASGKYRLVPNSTQNSTKQWKRMDGQVSVSSRSSRASNSAAAVII